MSTACWKRMIGSVYETPVVPVATGATLGVDTVSVSFGRKPEERRPGTNRVGKRQRAQAPGLDHPIPGLFWFDRHHLVPLRPAFRTMATTCRRRSARH